MNRWGVLLIGCGIGMLLAGVVFGGQVQIVHMLQDDMLSWRHASESTNRVLSDIALQLASVEKRQQALTETVLAAASPARREIIELRTRLRVLEQDAIKH